ncbi:hypothetical protein Tco_0529134 [Tanacetum coccineum]
MKKGFRGVPRPLLSAMLPIVAVDQSAGQADQAVDQPSPSEPLPSSSHPPVLSATPLSLNQTLAEQNKLPLHHLSQKPNSDPLITKVDSLETELKQTKLTMGKALVKLVKKVKKMEDVLKRRHVVLPDSAEYDAGLNHEVFKTPTQGKTLGEEDISPTTLEAAKTLSKVASQRSKSVDKGKRYKRRKESKGKDIDTGFEDISTGFEEDISTGLKSSYWWLRSSSTGFDDKDVSDIEDKVLLKSPQGDSETDKEESVEAMNPTPLDTKFNIVANWKIFQQGPSMLKDFTREDLIELYRLVMQKYGTNRPEDAYDRVLWSDLKTMFDPPLNEDAIWSLPLQQKMISWRYYDKCAVHSQNEDTQKNLKFTSEDKVRGGLLGIIINRLKSGSYRVKSGRHS